MKSEVKIIGFTRGLIDESGIEVNPCNVLAAAASISTTKYDANSALLNAINNGSEKNNSLIGNVLNSGHASFIEHAVFNIAFSNVSVFVEQFMIEFRLASFTVKSRRYVDFSNQGFVIPKFKEKPLLKKLYIETMNQLFTNYKKLLDMDISREDARFILPYSFRSNFFCTVNARELLNIIAALIFRGTGSSELVQIGESLRQQAEKILPTVFGIVEFNKYIKKMNLMQPEEEFQVPKLGVLPQPNVILLNQNDYNSRLNAAGYRIKAICFKNVKDVLKSSRPRELEHIFYNFSLNNMSLSCLTHFTRHRMLSMSIPSIPRYCYNTRFIIPPSVYERDTDEALSIYVDSFKIANDLYEKIISNGFKLDCVYSILSGCLIDIVCTMNARELLHFMKMRTCNRAQWEVRAYAVEMLRQLREVSPEIFNYIGPSCFMKECPEGRLSCGKCEEMKQVFGTTLEEQSCDFSKRYLDPLIQNCLK